MAEKNTKAETNKYAELRWSDVNKVDRKKLRTR